jgi:hypothetical protein
LSLFRGTAFVYSTVAGAEKKRSMLEIKSRLHGSIEAVRYNDGDAATVQPRSFPTADGAVVSIRRDIHFGYTGFNSHLKLGVEELNLITDVPTATQVLARRIVGSVLVSQGGRYKPTPLDAMYKGLDIPQEDDLITMLICGLAPPKLGSQEVVVVIVAVDEIQLLNDFKNLGSGRNELGLGRLFLRFLRQWQVDLISKNFLLILCTRHWDHVGLSV